MESMEASLVLDFDEDAMQGVSQVEQAAQALPALAPMAPPPAPAPGPPQRHVTDPLSEQPLKTGICWLSPTCDKKTYAKSKFCSAHKKEAEALKRDAEKSGKNALQFYLSQCSSQTLYSKMLIEFMGRCQSRGKGAGRERFNWVQYQEVRRGSKDQMRLGHMSQVFALTVTRVTGHRDALMLNDAASCCGCIMLPHVAS